MILELTRSLKWKILDAFLKRLYFFYYDVKDQNTNSLHMLRDLKFHIQLKSDQRWEIQSLKIQQIFLEGNNVLYDLKTTERHVFFVDGILEYTCLGWYLLSSMLYFPSDLLTIHFCTHIGVINMGIGKQCILLGNAHKILNQNKPNKSLPML